jgi:hypothetical protein
VPSNGSGGPRPEAARNALTSPADERTGSAAAAGGTARRIPRQRDRRRDAVCRQATRELNLLLDVPSLAEVAGIGEALDYHSTFLDRGVLEREAAGEGLA